MSRSSGSSATIDGAVPKHQPTLDEIIGAAKPVANEVKMKEEDQMMEIIGVTNLKASSDLGPQVVEAKRNAREEMHRV